MMASAPVLTVSDGPEGSAGAPSTTSTASTTSTTSTASALLGARLEQQQQQMDVTSRRPPPTTRGACRTPQTSYARRWQASIVPTNVIVIRNLADSILESQEAQEGFVAGLALYGTIQDHEFCPSENSVRVAFLDQQCAVLALGRLHDQSLSGDVSVHFATRQTLHDHGQFLQVPELTRQFLISPPASPPVGWEPCAEDPPVFNQELVDALAGLERFQPYELVPAEGSKPAICVCDYSDAPKPAAVIVAAEDDAGDIGTGVAGGLARAKEIPQTRMPPRPSHLE